MRTELREELRDIYYSEDADQSLRDWCFDSLCDDNRFLERAVDTLHVVNERWESWALPLAFGLIFMGGVATCAIVLG